MDADYHTMMKEVADQIQGLPLVPEVLRSIPGDLIETFLMAQVLSHLDDDLSNEAEALEILPDAFAVVYHTKSLDMEIAQGGFAQYFGQTGGEFAEEAVEALRAIGAEAAADTAEQALELFRKELSERPDLVDRMEQAEDGAFDEFRAILMHGEFDTLTATFSALLDEVAQLRSQYIADNIDAFVIPED